MKYFDTFLLLIIILMGIWIIYRDYTNDDLKRYNEQLMTELPQLIQDAIHEELFIYETETNE